MMQIDIGLLGAIIGMLVGISGTIVAARTRSKSDGEFVGEVRSEMKNLNKKFDTLESHVLEHNNLMQRLAVAENSLKSAHKRLDKMEE